MLDLDRFKQVNDTLGHAAGDALIRDFGSRISDLVQPDATVARLGGDEFVVLLPDVQSKQAVENICHKILSAAHRPFAVLGSEAFVGVSIGVVFSPESSTDRMELMRKADIALYHAKAAGRDCFRAFAPGMDESIKFRRRIEEDLRRALASGDELRVHYQPLVGAAGEPIVGVEALVRWQHPRRGLISPESFIPIAEETGLISQLGEWILVEACSAAKRWPQLFVAVNLSPAQFRMPKFAERVIEIVCEAGVDPGQIELEVTETVLLHDDEAITVALNKLRDAGFKIALDDFGTGYSSLSHLRKFEVDKIKIDRTFVQNLGTTDSTAIVTAVVNLAHAMGLQVSAEGVETKHQSTFLTAAGCNVMQGFLFSKAVPHDEMEALLSIERDKKQAA
jgi:diguanylate cyclase (GGDEF)-like protein